MKKSKLADKQLIDDFQSVNRFDSFDELYNRYIRKVYRTCLSMTNDTLTAEDYTQDIFIKVFERLHAFHNRSSFSTWLYAITRNHCLDQLRFSKRIPYESLSAYLAAGEPYYVAETDSTELPDYRLQRLTNTINQLPEEELTLFKLRYEQGLSIRDISARCQLTEGNVKVRLKRTRDKLKKLYTT
ncbi:RNA polymerase sigma factor [Spirosoma sp. BT702]|uniref:RNA polymerase sigma factor n=1 Tax=Spirosoma profusum TaxID=2771354 RepID=A0A926Y0R0_9BACT|nr:RNA polymerase sigma factor [Spirosoma profusum]MBD2704509.1 RNA polymerase sigma factor [Spirosoma profusum]